MNELKKALAGADEAYLAAMSNKGIYKRACKDTAGMLPLYCETGDSMTVDISGETVTVTVPLENSRCSCVSRTVCRHIIGAILLLRSALTEDEMADSVTDLQEEPQAKEEKAPEPPKQDDIAKVLTDSEKQKIKICGADCLTLLGDILQNGIVRLPDAVSDNAEVMAVRCHALKMADGERAMRSIGSRLGDYIAGRAAFSAENFTSQLCRSIRIMKQILDDDLNAEMLGSFRQEYALVQRPLKILPIGQRSVSGGDYEGNVYYFLDLEAEEKPFLSLSDLRPVFYDTAKKRSRGVYPWGMTTPLSKMMRKSMVLVNAKVSDGKLSASQETKIAMTTDANMNCNEMQRLIYTDFRRAAAELYEKFPTTELECLMLIHPKKCAASDFDKVSQTYTLTLEDFDGNCAYVRIKYRKENREFVEQVERIGGKMMENTEKRYTILALGSIENSRLELYPIEIYDFIEVPYWGEEYELPEEYAVSAEELAYSQTIRELLKEIREALSLAVQCGLRTGVSGFTKLENTAFNYGMKGLSRLCGEFGRFADGYRHNINCDIRAILYKLAEIEEYVSAAENRLEIILTLNRRTEK